MTHHFEFRHQYERVGDDIYCFGREAIQQAHEWTTKLIAQNKYSDMVYETALRGRLGESAVIQWLDDNLYSPRQGPEYGADIEIPDHNNNPIPIEVKTRALYLPARPTDRVNIETRQLYQLKNRIFIFACAWRVIEDELIAIRVVGWLHGHEIEQVMELIQAGQPIGRHGKTAHKPMLTCTINKLRPMKTL